MKRQRPWLSALAAWAALPAFANVDDPNDLIQGRWFATEVIIFERSEPADPGPEALVWEGGRSWPVTARAFAEPESWRIASLDPLTRACLEFPRLEIVPTTATSAPGSNAEQMEVEDVEQMEVEDTEQAPGSTVHAAPKGNGAAEPSGLEAPAFHPLEAGADTMPLDGLTLAKPVAPVPIPPPPIDPRLSPHPLIDLLNAAARQQEALRRDSYRWLAARTHALGAQVRRLRDVQGLHIIWHGRWIQPVPSRSAGEPLMLAAQPTQSRGRLTGTLQVTLGRYLHFEARLWLEQERAPEDGTGTIPYMRLHQARTMRSGELHYLDHPRVGVLVRIDRAPPSPALERALQAWETWGNDG